MTLHRRFILQFFIQLLVLSLVFFFTLVAVWAIIGFSISEEEVSRDLADADSSYFINKINMEEDKVTFDEELTSLITEQNGWLMAVDASGKVLNSYGAPETLAAEFQVTDMMDFMIGEHPSNRQRTYWKLELFDEEPLYLFFEKENIAASLVAAIEPQIDWQKASLNLSAAAKKQAEADNVWIQLLDQEGTVLQSYGRKNNAAYTTEEIASLGEEGSLTAAHLDISTGRAVIAGLDEPSSIVPQTAFANRTIISILLLVLAPLIIGTFCYARKFGLPLLVMMQWIQNLGNNQFEQPLDQNKQPILINKKGRLKRKYRLHKELISTLEQLTETLKTHKNQRQESEKAREDWISGLSHDLKTPLSSISGYAQMLEADSYDWSETETRQFAGVISEKSVYMMDLLEELTLTFRLQNNALRLVREELDINEAIRRTIIQFINEPANHGIHIEYQPYLKGLVARVDAKWFQRIIDNLIANAIKYNPPGTLIHVSISTIEQHLFIVHIEDDGIGMDAQTLNKMFDRYYRGSNTSDSGTGSGLGMAITKQLIQLHDGSINVTSSPGQGTAVRVILPMR